MTKLIDLTGQKFKSLLVVDRALDKDNKITKWNCICDCGHKNIITSNNLINGKRNQCKFCNKRPEKTFGLSGNYLYMAWSSIKQRCFNVKDKRYASYGGRGISMCQEWFYDFHKFASHIGERPSSDHSIERIDNHGNYEPGNVKWATAYEQNSNKRTNAIMTFNGEALTMAQWSRKLGIKFNTLNERIKRGWSTERTLTILPSCSNKAKSKNQIINMENK